MSSFAESIENMGVPDLLDLKDCLEVQIDGCQNTMSEISHKLRNVNQAIYEKTPRDLSLAEVERLLGFKVNIVEGDKLWIHE